MLATCECHFLLSLKHKLPSCLECKQVTGAADSGCGGVSILKSIFNYSFKMLKMIETLNILCA